ncbi:hypothetical protein NE237_011023 [Protea cynaroides]|uniref:RNase H type-1 domain-containing protein n=1 Tax=Protea cynaroides TaxID=273540 RepID=A0A9Q0GVE3_9MAGN|nr:hypothetical protein NE237_011023 [Protea cynaroides]
MLEDIWMEGLILVACKLWLSRNLACFEGVRQCSQGILMRMVNDMRDISLWHPGIISSINELEFTPRFHLNRGYRKSPTIKQVLWTKSFGRWVKLNVDGSSFGNPGPASAGGIFRNANGEVIAMFSAYIRLATNYIADFTALMIGLQHASEFDFTNPWMECDWTAGVPSLLS